MRKESPYPGNTFAKFLPFVVGAMMVGGLVVACDRSSIPESSGDPPASAPIHDSSAPSRSAPPTAPAPALPARESLSDTAITTRIKGEILHDSSLGGSDISVVTDSGVVALTGLVKTPEQIAIASAHAQRQDGVVRVDNHLGVATH